jgi:hypothetical protein
LDAGLRENLWSYCIHFTIELPNLGQQSDSSPWVEKGIRILFKRVPHLSWFEFGDIPVRQIRQEDLWLTEIVDMGSSVLSRALSCTQNLVHLQLGAFDLTCLAQAIEKGSLPNLTRLSLTGNAFPFRPNDNQEGDSWQMMRVSRPTATPTHSPCCGPGICQ